MTAETLKPFLAATTNNITKPNSNGIEKSTKLFKNNKNLLILCITCVFLIFCVVASTLQIWNMQRISELEKETAHLKHSFEKVRKHLEFYDEINEFENAYGRRDEDLEIDAKIPSTLPDKSEEHDNSGDEFEFDDEEEEEDDEDYDMTGSGFHDLFSDDDDYGDDEEEDEENSEETDETFGKTRTGAENKLDDGNIYNDMKKRKIRSIAGITHQGVPILEEPYTPSRNRTAQSTSFLDDHVTHILIPTNRDSNKAKDPKLKLKWDRNNRREYANERQHSKFHSRHHHNLQANPHRTPAEATRATDFQQEKKNSTGITTKTPQPIYTRKSRVMATDDGPKYQNHRQVIIRDEKGIYNRYMDFRKAPDQYAVHPRKRVHHKLKKNLELKNHKRTQRRLAAHYNGNYGLQTSGNYNTNRKPNRFEMSSGEIFKWSPSPWIEERGMNHFFKMENGVLTVNDHGLYFVYAQVLYMSSQHEYGFKVYHNNAVALQCNTMTPSEKHPVKTNTCYTSGLIELNAGSQLRVNEIGSNRIVVLEPGKSFFGLFKVILTPPTVEQDGN